MTKQVINVGISANDRKGDSLRAAFQKTNANFTELYDRAVNTDSQTLTLTGDTLAISGGNSVDLSKYVDPTFSGDYDDLTNKPTIPTVPTTISSFTNDAGFITAADIPRDYQGSVFADDSTLLVDGVNGKIVGPLEGNSFLGTIDFTGATVTGLKFVAVEYRTAFTDDSMIYTVDLFQFKMTSGNLQMRLVAPAGVVISASVSSVENINQTISGNVTGTLNLSDSVWTTINGNPTASHGDTIVASVVSPQDGRMYRVTVFRGNISDLHRVIIETLAK